MLYCSSCKKYKENKEFSKNKAYVTGYQTFCKACFKKKYQGKSKKKTYTGTMIDGEVKSLDPAIKMGRDEFLKWYNSFDKSLLNDYNNSIAPRN
jgi:hypothetical protein